MKVAPFLKVITLFNEPSGTLITCTAKSEIKQRAEPERVCCSKHTFDCRSHVC